MDNDQLSGQSIENQSYERVPFQQDEQIPKDDHIDQIDFGLSQLQDFEQDEFKFHPNSLRKKAMTRPRRRKNDSEYFDLEIHQAPRLLFAQNEYNDNNNALQEKEDDFEFEAPQQKKGYDDDDANYDDLSGNQLQNESNSLQQYEKSLFPENESDQKLSDIMSQRQASLLNSVLNNSEKKVATVKTKGQKKQLNGGQKTMAGTATARTRKKVDMSKQKVQNKKRFSKTQLELLSRKFSEYYAFETNLDNTLQPISLKTIGTMFQLGHTTIHKMYAEWMEDPYFYQRIKRYDKYRRQPKNPQRKLTLDRLEHLSRIVKENPFYTQHELCATMNKIPDLKVIKHGEYQDMTRTVISKLLKMGKFRKKRVKCIPKQKNTSKSLQKRVQYCIKYKQIIQVKKARVYFLDESGFNLYMTRDKAWSRPNEQITVNCPISKGKRFSLIAIIGVDGLAHWRFIEGNYRKFEYLDFIRELFHKLNETKHPQDNEERWIVLDNCAIHDKEQTISLAAEYGLNVLYLPSYSPQLNPIENWFHEIKCKLKKFNYNGENQLFMIMEKLLAGYNDADFSNYYSGAMKYVNKGIKREKF